MSDVDVVVCDYGAGNVRSVTIAFERLAARVAVTGSPDAIASAGIAVLPGVGSARSAMAALRERGIDIALTQRVNEGRAVLGICLGLQLAVEWSDEDGGVACMGILPGRARPLTGKPVPRLGWADVSPWSETFYFAHSYAVDTPAAVAMSDGVVAAACAGSFVGVQFHPEKSGPAGLRFLQQCLTLV